MRDHPAVTVALPLYNGAAHVLAAIDSVLGQSGWQCHIVVVDDGSTDGGADLVVERHGADSRVELIRLGRNRGVAHARNVAVESRSDPLVAMIDQDDLWRPHRLDAGWAALQADPELGYVLGHQVFLPSPGPRPRWFRSRWGEGPQTGFVFGTMLARRDRGWEAVGRLRESLTGGTDDVDWFARARDLGVRSRMLPEVLLERRVHESNASARTAQSTAEMAGILRASLRRRDAVPADGAQTPLEVSDRAGA